MEINLGQVNLTKVKKVTDGDILIPNGTVYAEGKLVQVIFTIKDKACRLFLSSLAHNLTQGKSLDIGVLSVPVIIEKDGIILLRDKTEFEIRIFDKSKNGYSLVKLIQVELAKKPRMFRIF